LQLLKGVAPQLTEVGLLFNPETEPYSKFFMRSIEAASTTYQLSVSEAAAHNTSDLEQTIALLAARPKAGLVVIPGLFTAGHHDLIVQIVNRWRLPAIYPFRYFADGGGLMSYGVDTIDMFRQAGSYVDRILRGQKPADLPVQAPTKFQLIINLRTAKLLGIDVPPMLLALADEAIE
jgi:putative ABC transport system substrate-binding protein